MVPLSWTAVWLLMRRWRCVWLCRWAGDSGSSGYTNALQSSQTEIGPGRQSCRWSQSSCRGHRQTKCPPGCSPSHSTRCPGLWIAPGKCINKNASAYKCTVTERMAARKKASNLPSGRIFRVLRNNHTCCLTLLFFGGNCRPVVWDHLCTSLNKLEHHSGRAITMMIVVAPTDSRKRRKNIRKRGRSKTTNKQTKQNKSRERITKKKTKREKKRKNNNNNNKINLKKAEEDEEELIEKKRFHDTHNHMTKQLMGPPISSLSTSTHLSCMLHIVHVKQSPTGVEQSTRGVQHPLVLWVVDAAWDVHRAFQHLLSILRQLVDAGSTKWDNDWMNHCFAGCGCHMRCTQGIPTLFLHTEAAGQYWKYKLRPCTIVLWALDATWDVHRAFQHLLSMINETMYLHFMYTGHPNTFFSILRQLVDSGSTNWDNEPLFYGPWILQEMYTGHSNTFSWLSIPGWRCEFSWSSDNQV